MAAGSADNVDKGWAWVILATSFMCLFLSCGALYSVSVFNVIFLEVFQESKAWTSVIGALLIGLIAMVGPVSSYVTNTFGWRVAVVAGGAIATIGTGLASTASSVVGLMVFYGLISGIGHGLVYTSAIVVVGYYFEKYRTLASGIASVGAGVGMMSFPPLIRYLNEFCSWREILVYISCLYAHICIFGMLMRPLSTDKPNSSPENSSNETALLSEQNGYAKILVQTESTAYLTNPVEQDKCSSNGVGNRLSLYANGHVDGALVVNCSVENDSFLKHEIVDGYYQKETNGKPPLVVSVNLPRKLSISSINSTLCSCTQIGQYFGTCCGYTCHCMRQDSTTDPCYSASILSRKFFTFCLSIFVFGLGLSALYLHLSAFAISKGASETEASYLVTVLGIASIISRIFTGFAGNDSSVDNSILYIGAFGVAGIATMSCPLFGSTYYGRMIFVILFGFYGSCFNVLLAPLTVELIGLKNLTTAFGVEMVVNGLAYFMGPPLAGRLYDVSASYDSSFFLAGISLILSSFVMMLVSVSTDKERRDIILASVPS